LLIEPLAAAVLVIVAVWLLPHPAPRMPAAANGSALLMIRSTGRTVPEAQAKYVSG
jgi:hypothetical protein